MTLGVRQYKRQVALEVGQAGKPGRRFEGLRIGFNITKTDSKKPSKGKIQIYNLSEDSRAALEKDESRILLYAGYANPDLIFTGDIDDVEHSKDDLDMVSTIEAADGRRLFQSGSLFETYGPPLDSNILLRRLASAMPIEIGHISSDLEVITYTQGYTVAGPIRDALDEVTTSIGARWSIQDGELIITPVGKGVPQQAFLVSPTTGLIGTPKKTKRGIKFSILLNGQVRPRRIVRMESRDFKGFYLVKKVELVGDSGWDQSFYCNIEAQES